VVPLIGYVDRFSARPGETVAEFIMTAFQQNLRLQKLQKIAMDKRVRPIWFAYTEVIRIRNRDTRSEKSSRRSTGDDRVGPYERDVSSDFFQPRGSIKVMFSKFYAIYIVAELRIDQIAKSRI
jgi:hypothetical protein